MADVTVFGPKEEQVSIESARLEGAVMVAPSPSFKVPADMWSDVRTVETREEALKFYEMTVRPKCAL